MDLQKNLGYLDGFNTNELRYHEFQRQNSLLSFDLSRDGLCVSSVSAGPQEGSLSFNAVFHAGTHDALQFVFLLVS